MILMQRLVSDVARHGLGGRTITHQNFSPRVVKFITDSGGPEKKLSDTAATTTVNIKININCTRNSTPFQFPSSVSKWNSPVTENMLMIPLLNV